MLGPLQKMEFKMRHLKGKHCNIIKLCKKQMCFFPQISHLHFPLSSPYNFWHCCLHFIFSLPCWVGFLISMNLCFLNSVISQGDLNFYLRQFCVRKGHPKDWQGELEGVNGKFSWEVCALCRPTKLPYKLDVIRVCVYPQCCKRWKAGLGQGVSLHM